MVHVHTLALAATFPVPNRTAFRPLALHLQRQLKIVADRLLQREGQGHRLARGTRVISCLGPQRRRRLRNRRILRTAVVEQIIDSVNTLCRTTGLSVLLVEQNANMALNAADRGYVLENGRIVMQDTCERLREKEDIREFYLGIKEDGVRTERRWKKKKTWR